MDDRHRHPETGHELHGSQKYFPFGFYHVFSAVASACVGSLPSIAAYRGYSALLTPADSNEAISRRNNTADWSKGTAMAAPVPSPKRRPRFSNGSASRYSSILACPLSPL